jgi:uncharacterized membrane protein
MMNRPPGNGFYWQEGARHSHDGWCGGPLHVILLILLLALLIGGGVLLIRRLWPGSSTQAAVPAVAAVATTEDPAVAALRLRYAKGEVSREDFRHAMQDLTGVAEPPGSSLDAGSPPAAS